MKKTIGLLIFGMVLGISSAFSAGSMELDSVQNAFNAEIELLAKDVNFENQSEIIAFENAIRRSGSFTNYMIAIRSFYGDYFSEDYLIEQTIQEQREKQIELRKLNEAEIWSARNITAGAILFDLEMQQRINEEFERNTEQARLNAEQEYKGNILQYTGTVGSVEKKYGWNEPDYFQVYLRRTDGASVFAYFTMDRADSVQRIKVGDVITITGRCNWFIGRSSAPWGLSSVNLGDSVIRFVAN